MFICRFGHDLVIYWLRVQNCWQVFELLLSAQIVLFCMDFALNELLHNRKLPFRYNSCELFERQDLSGFRVISKHCLLRTIRANDPTVQVGYASKLSLNRRDIKVTRSSLQEVLALFCENPILNTKQCIQPETGENSSSRISEFRNLSRQASTGISIRENKLSRLSGAQRLSIATS